MPKEKWTNPMEAAKRLVSHRQTEPDRSRWGPPLRTTVRLSASGIEPANISKRGPLVDYCPAFHSFSDIRVLEVYPRRMKSSARCDADLARQDCNHHPQPLRHHSYAVCVPQRRASLDKEAIGLKRRLSPDATSAVEGSQIFSHSWASAGVTQCLPSSYHFDQKGPCNWQGMSPNETAALYRTNSRSTVQFSSSFFILSPIISAAIRHVKVLITINGTFCGIAYL